MAKRCSESNSTKYYKSCFDLPSEHRHRISSQFFSKKVEEFIPFLMYGHYASETESSTKQEQAQKVQSYLYNLFQYSFYLICNHF